MKASRFNFRPRAARRFRAAGALSLVAVPALAFGLVC